MELDILQHPLVIALLALLAVPGATSVLTAGIKRLTEWTGISAKVWVYVASLALTALMVYGTGLPGVDGDPATTVGLWLTWATVNATAARRLYEALWERVDQYGGEPW